MKSFLKWPGGKSKLAPKIAEKLGAINKYYEPFFGGGSVFFYLKANNLIKGDSFISDANSELITTLRVVQSNVHDLIEQLKQFPTDNPEKFYYDLRESKPTDDLDIATRFIYLRKTCFNGLYRENASGYFNVPRGNYKKVNICDEETLLNCSFLLRNAYIEHRYFEQLIVDDKATVYLDPPYIPLNPTSNFTNYTASGFNYHDHVKLMNWMVKNSSANLLQSNSNTPLVRELYSNFNIEQITALRSIGAKPESREKVKELLISIK
jgi:DNA adenine methylase